MACLSVQHGREVGHQELVEAEYTIFTSRSRHSEFWCCILLLPFIQSGASAHAKLTPTVEVPISVNPVLETL